VLLWSGFKHSNLCFEGKMRRLWILALFLVGCGGQPATTPPLSFQPITLPAGEIGVIYTAQLSTTGGVAPYSYSIVSGSLPQNLSLTTGGEITGTPVQAGEFNFTVEVQDSEGEMADTQIRGGIK
jgi:hypothetical protein